MHTVVPFQFEAPEAELVDLKARLHATRWPSEIPGVGWDRGVPLDVMQELVAVWLHTYDWRQTEARLASQCQFATTIEGQRLHFIHHRAADPEAVPVMLIHGWPSSPLAFERVGDLLQRDHHVVVPSIPGFGFSGPLTSPGWSSGRVARAFVELMTRLGYARFVVHGGDAGAIIAREMALAHPERLHGAHVQQAFSFPSGDPEAFASLGPEDQQRLARLEQFGARDGYNQIMGKRPQAIAFAMNDSPVGLLGWVLELFATFGDFPAQLTPTQILDQVTLMWLTQTLGSSANLYFETARSGAWERTEPTDIPFGVAVFPNDFLSIRAFAERDHRQIVHWSEFDRGGHFAALEVPALLAEDVRAFVDKACR